MAQFLMIVRGNSTASPDRIAALGREESVCLWRAFTSGHVRTMHYIAGHAGAVLMLEASNFAAAELLARSFPMVRAGLVDLELIGIEPYTGLERLFALSEARLR
jgi:hypothetical protein